MALTLHIQQPAEWRQARDIRIAMLADTPVAYLDTLQDALERSDAEWERRYRVRLGPGWRAVAVVDEEGVWRGQMIVHVEAGKSPRPWLLAVWVHPDFRGHRFGAASMMLDELVAWLREQGLGELWLEVHESNQRAIGFYRRYGFVATGQRRPYPLDATTMELEMRLDLALIGD